MNLVELRNAADTAIQFAQECEENPLDIVVSLQINHGGHDGTQSSDEVELHYDNNGMASGCVITAWLEVEHPAKMQVDEPMAKFFSDQVNGAHKGHMDWIPNSPILDSLCKAHGVKSEEDLAAFLRGVADHLDKKADK